MDGQDVDVDRTQCRVFIENAGAFFRCASFAMCGSEAIYESAIALQHARTPLLSYIAFAEENVDQRLRLIRVQALIEQLDLAAQTLVKRERGRAFDGVDGGERSDQFGTALARAATGSGEDLRAGGELFIAIAGRTWLRSPLGKPYGAFQQLAFDDLIHDSGITRFTSADRLAERAHAQCQFDPGQSRQPLRTARSRDQTELHLRLTHLRVRCRHAVVAGHRGLEAAAQRRAMNRGDHRFRAVLDVVQQWIQRRQGQFQKLANIGARDKGSPGTHEHYGTNLTVAFQSFHGLLQLQRNRSAQRVDRRVVDREDAHCTPAGNNHEAAHAR